MFIFSVSLLHAQEDALKLFNTANDLYQKGQYTNAIDSYNRLITQNTVNPTLYYNLGNAYYKNQQIGMAIVYYEKALQLSPRNSDVHYNIDFINKMLKEPAPSFFDQLMSAVNSIASLNELTVAGSFIFLLFIVFLSILLFKHSNLLISAALISFVFLILTGAILGLKINNEVLTQWAIVVSTPADVRNGPGFDNSVGFSLPEGKKVMVLGQKDEWVAVGLKNEGLKGWIERKYINEI
jgi:tetratricopeptide (TPR) repeat protein